MVLHSEEKRLPLTARLVDVPCRSQRGEDNVGIICAECLVHAV